MGPKKGPSGLKSGPDGLKWIRVFRAARDGVCHALAGILVNTALPGVISTAIKTEYLYGDL